MASADAPVLRGAIPATLAVGALGTIIGFAVAGPKGALGGLIGTVIVVVFFTVGQVALGSVLRTNPQMALTVALMIYLIKVGVLLGLIILFQGTTAFDTKVFALTILACTLTWTVAEVWIFSRAKVLYVDPAPMDRPRHD